MCWNSFFTSAAAMTFYSLSYFMHCTQNVHSMRHLFSCCSCKANLNGVFEHEHERLTGRTCFAPLGLSFLLVFLTFKVIE